MRREHIAVILFAAFVTIAVYLFFRVMKPFLVPIIWGAVLSGVFYPINNRLRRRLKRDNLRALIMCALAALVIILPVVFLAFGLASEATDLYPRFKAALGAGRYDFILRPHVYGWNEKVRQLLGDRVDTSSLDVESFILANVDRISRFLVNQLSRFIGNLSLAIVTFVFTLISMFYFFRDGDHLVRRVRELLPMSEDLKATLSHRITEVVHATIYGGVAVALVQGILGGLIFWILGIRSPILWGAVMALFALIPPLGPSLIYVPAAIILGISGSWVKAVILAALGVVLISNVDNVMKPLIIGKRAKMHQLILLFSIIGGIMAFGLVGIILGPVLAAIILALLEVYRPHAGSTG